MDVRHLSFEADSFDVVIDKGANAGRPCTTGVAHDDSFRHYGCHDDL